MSVRICLELALPRPKSVATERSRGSTYFRGGKTRERRVQLELAKSASTACVDRALRDTLVIEVADLLPVVEILEHCWTPRTGT